MEKMVLPTVIGTDKMDKNREYKLVDYDNNLVVDDVLD